MHKKVDSLIIIINNEEAILITFLIEYPFRIVIKFLLSVSEVY